MERLPINIIQGKTFERVVRWETEPFIYVPIASIARSAPARIVTDIAHGLQDGWRVAVVSAGGMREINAESNPPKERDYTRCTVIDPETVDLNKINAAEFSAYTSGGYLQFYTPMSLAGCTARLVIKDRVGGTELVRLTESDGITLNDDTKTIKYRFEAEDSADYAWRSGVYELEIENADGVTGLHCGPVTVTREVAT